jgi:hypothetical protein
MDPATMQRQIDDLKDLVLQLNAQIMSPAPATSRPLKLPLPDLFEGDVIKTLVWLQNIDQYFKGRGGEFQTDEHKIIFALSLVKDKTLAGEWKYQMLAKEKRDGKAVWDAYAAFTAAVEAQFKDHNSENSATLALQKIQQGRRNVDVYVAEFKSLAIKTKLNDVAL